MSRVGLGVDAHPLAEGRTLRLGGVEVPFERGLQGHSDGDVLLHAIMEALLGAAGLGDLGAHFPPSDPQYEGMDSRLLLRQVGEKVAGAGWKVVNLDATIVAEQPHLAPHLPRMRQAIASALGVEEGRVNLKAKSPEGMGFAGRGEGMVAFAVALLEETP